MASMKKRLRDAEERIAQLERNESCKKVGKKVTIQYGGWIHILYVGDSLTIKDGTELKVVAID